MSTRDFRVEGRLTAQADGYCIRTAVVCMLKYLLVHRNGKFNTWILKVCQLFGAGIIWHIVFWKFFGFFFFIGNAYYLNICRQFVWVGGCLNDESCYHRRQISQWILDLPNQWSEISVKLVKNQLSCVQPTLIFENNMYCKVTLENQFI